MPFKLFKSRKSLKSKAKASKKEEPVHGRDNGADAHIEERDTGTDALNAPPESTAAPDSQAIESSAAAGDQPTGMQEVDGTSSGIAANGEPTDTAQRASGPPTDILDPAVTEGDDDTPADPMVDFVLGPRDASSPYFTQRFVRAPASSIPVIAHILSRPEDSDQVRILRDVDPHAFQMYLDFRACGTLDLTLDFLGTPPDSADRWRCSWPLLNAHILGFKIGAYGFADRVMDELQVLTRDAGCPDIDTVRHIFSKEEDDIANILRLYLVDRCIQAGLEGMGSHNLRHLPRKFSQLILERTFIKRTNGEGTSQEPGRTYHLLETPDMGSATVVPSDEDARAERHDSEGADPDTGAGEGSSGPSSGAVRSEHRQQQWEDANRALRERRGVRWIGFRRPVEIAGHIMLSGSGEPSRETPDVLPTYQSTVSGQEQHATTANQREENASQASSTQSNRSRPDSEIRASFETALEWERRAACPGAFPG